MAQPTTNAELREAYEEHRVVRVVSSDPPASERVDGSIWYRSDNDEFRAQVNGSLVTLDNTAV
jgi:hypothetical protein